jgi:hypothetical protein
MSWLKKTLCKWGCGQGYYNADTNPALRRHEAIPHIRCTCGRTLSVRGLRPHLRMAKNHPPYDPTLQQAADQARAWAER